jgi:hypothetical protein
MFTLATELVPRFPVAASRPDPSLNTSFPTTRWSQVVAAGDRADPAARDALAELCGAYWYPICAFIRRKGHDPEEALDVKRPAYPIPTPRVLYNEALSLISGHLD